MKRVLVTSGDTRVAYNICKNLSQNGYAVYIGERHAFNMASCSKYCAGKMIYSSPFTRQEQFIREINAFCEQHGIDVIMPVLEETYTLAKYRELLRTGARLFLPDYSQILTVHDKGRLTATAKSLGIPTPRTWELVELLLNPERFAELDFPVILKPKQGGGGWGMRKFHRAEELLCAARDETMAPEDFIVQTIVQGQLMGVCGIYHSGKCLASDSYLLTSVYPPQVGQSTIRESIVAPDALRAFTTLLDHLQWNGVCQMDFIMDPKSGGCRLLDANPRFWGSIAHNIAAGMPYPVYYCQLAQGHVPATGVARAGTRTRWLGGDVMRLFTEWKQNGRAWSCLKQAFLPSPGFAANDDWDMRDPLPFAVWGINMVANKLLHRKKDALPGVWA